MSDSNANTPDRTDLKTQTTSETTSEENTGSDDGDTPEYGYRKTSIILAGTATDAPSIASEIGIDPNGIEDLDVLLFMNPANAFEYVHFVFSGVTRTWNWAETDVQAIESKLTTVDVDDAVDNGRYHLADIGYDILHQLLMQSNGDGGSVIQIDPATTTFDLERSLATVGVLLATTDYMLP